MPESGKNLHFNVKDMTYGITSPIESITPDRPQREKTEKLTYIEGLLPSLGIPLFSITIRKTIFPTKETIS